MAGHSHSANIKHRKDAVDKKRGKIFSKIARKLIVEAKNGPDIAMNPGLRLIVDQARAANMPKDVIQRNIDKGSGVGADAVNFEDLCYEGYGSGGIAILCEALTDNRNRTSPEIKKIFEKAGGNMGNPGCVAYLFESKSVFLAAGENSNEEAVMEALIEADADADDLEGVDDGVLVTAAATDFLNVKTALESAGYTIEIGEIQRLPLNSVEIDDLEHAKKIQRLVDNLEDNDDVQNVYGNHSFSEEVMKALDSED